MYGDAAAYTAKRQAEDKNIDDEDYEDLQQKIYTSRKPDDWLAFVLSDGGTMPEIIREFIKSAARQIIEAREGTIEEHLKLISQTL